MSGKHKTQSLKNGWKTILKHLLSHKSEVVLLSVLGIVSATANGFVPYIVGRFFDAILDTTHIAIGSVITIPLWLAIIILWFAAQLIANSTDWVIERRASVLATQMEADYLSKCYRYLLQLPLSFHKTRKRGEIGDRLNRAIQFMSTIVERIIIHLAPQFLSVILGLIIVVSIDYRFGIVLIAGIALYIVVLMRIVPPAVKLQQRIFDVFGSIFGDLYSGLYNVQTVKQATAEMYESQKLHKKYVGTALRLWTRIQAVWSSVGFYQRLIVTITQLSIFVMSVFFIFKGLMTIGDLIALNGYSMMVFGPFVTLGYNWQTVQNGALAVDKAEEMLRLQTEVYTPPHAVRLSKVRGEVEFKHVYFSYAKGERGILKDISFHVIPGQVVALVGESGVGKSTLIDLISGYYFPNRGSVLIDGHDIKKINLNVLRSNIAVVPQEVILFNDTVKMNIRYGNFKATEDEVRRVAQLAYADVFIETLPKGYDQIVGERGIKLSVGQKQRIAIARAILRDPSILILDEPTSALDPQSEKLITESLHTLMKGRTTFIIAHRLSTVRRADVIFVFEKGQLVEQGTHNELLATKGVYERLYQLHVGLA